LAAADARPMNRRDAEMGEDFSFLIYLDSVGLGWIPPNLQRDSTIILTTDCRQNPKSEIRNQNWNREIRGTREHGIVQLRLLIQTASMTFINHTFRNVPVAAAGIQLLDLAGFGWIPPNLQGESGVRRRLV
jgi:hypothetical protein